MSKMFHVEQKIKNLLQKGFFVFFISLIVFSCVTPRHTVEVGDYLLLPDGKHVLGREKGLTCFFFENNRNIKMFYLKFNQMIKY